MQATYSAIALDSRIGSHRPRKFPCPSCGKKTFVKYWNHAAGEYLPAHLGRCDREESCSYHEKPGPEYFRKAPEAPNRLPESILRASMKAYHTNSFHALLNRLFGPVEARNLADLYKLGTTQKGEAVFWQVDGQGEIRSGKIMQYKTDGHRTGGTDWVHSRLERMGKLSGFDLEQCFFGEHLLQASPIDKPVGIVESEKTAILAAGYLQSFGFAWLAAGSKDGMGGKALNRGKCSILAGREVILFPDLTKPDSQAPETCFEHWQRIARQLNEQLGCNARVSPFLEEIATPERRAKQWDLADYLIWANEYAPERGQYVIPAHLINYSNPSHPHYMPF